MNNKGEKTYFILSDFLAQDRKQFENNCPRGCQIIDFNSEMIEPKFLSKSPTVFFVPIDRWENISSQSTKGVWCSTGSGILGTDLSTQIVLVVGDKKSVDIYDIEPPENFLGYLHLPVSRKKMAYFRDRAAEAHNLYLDLNHMAREIALERELLARKNEQLSFLNRILTKAVATLDVSKILDLAREEFSVIVETKDVLGVFWDNENELEPQIFLPLIDSPELEQRWIEYLLQISQKFNHRETESYQVNRLAHKVGDDFLEPETGYLILIPLKIAQEVFGTLIAVPAQFPNLGRDQVQILHSAGNHLGLAIRNALKYKKVRIEADHDGLTGVFNRKAFDLRLKLELKRHQRNGQSLSLLMLDFDYFKKINDTYGHLAGDMVLQRSARLLKNTVRETDFVARYGGEEFVLLLPETNEEEAWLLAQRLRQKIQKMNFSFHGKKFNVTASIGVASLKPDPFTPAEILIDQADEALYLAKNSGRNMVCISSGHGDVFQCVAKL
ncbi:GGDEF domain-containing protein [Desulfovulcanus sp.]